MSKNLRMPRTGEMVEQGGPEDRATWLTCQVCSFTGPHVGLTEDGEPACLGSCGGVKPNPEAPRLPEGTSVPVEDLSEDQVKDLMTQLFQVLIQEDQQ